MACRGQTAAVNAELKPETLYFARFTPASAGGSASPRSQRGSIHKVHPRDPVTGVLASLLMASVGDVVSAATHGLSLGL